MFSSVIFIGLVSALILLTNLLNCYLFLKHTSEDLVTCTISRYMGIRQHFTKPRGVNMIFFLQKRFLVSVVSLCNLVYHVATKSGVAVT